MYFKPIKHKHFFSLLVTLLGAGHHHCVSMPMLVLFFLFRKAFVRMLHFDNIAQMALLASILASGVCLASLAFISISPPFSCSNDATCNLENSAVWL